MKFITHYEKLDSSHLDYGSVALLPWDEDIFHFPVGDFQISNSVTPTHREELLRLLDHWCDRNEIHLLSMKCAADHFDLIHLAHELGFRFIDQSVCVIGSGSRIQLPKLRVKLEPAELSDLPALQEIAATSFQFGRYLQDCRFPKDLAKERNRTFIANAFKYRSEGTRIYVLRDKGIAVGFFYAEIEKDVADLRLGGVDNEHKNGFTGVGMFASVIESLLAEGVVHLRADISMANLSVLNIYTSFRFHFVNPSIIFHKHYIRSNVKIKL